MGFGARWESVGKSVDRKAWKKREKAWTCTPNPLLPPDNNAAEGALRINALIRKNSMFFGSEDGAERAAVALTILHNCRLAGVEPLRYLQQVTPTLLLHAKGRKQDLCKLTPLAMAKRDETTPTS